MGYTFYSDGLHMGARLHCGMHYITKYGSTLYIGMDEVLKHHAHTFEKSDLNFHFQCEFSSFAAEG